MHKESFSENMFSRISEKHTICNCSDFMQEMWTCDQLYFILTYSLFVFLNVLQQLQLFCIDLS